MGVDYSILLISSIKAALKAGDAILEVYDSDFAVEQKEDKSPLTLADKRSHEVIKGYLESLRIPELDKPIPLLSEEGEEISYDERTSWDYLWIVDPLDGTKEFIKRNGEFTVNIALVYKQTPVMGIIYVPVLDILYFAAEGIGSYRLENVRDMKKPFLNQEQALSSLCNQSQKMPVFQDNKKFTVVASRSHMSDETKSYIEQLEKKQGDIEILSMGSSLKICMVAEGSANIYPRFGPTMEWDTAAGHAIAAIAGARVTTFPEDKELSYNKEILKNPYFLVAMDLDVKN